jgi:serine/threonine protein kinase
MTKDPLQIVGRFLGGYSVVAYLDSGAFGFVYAAQESATGADVALKILHPRAQAPEHQEFDNEANLLSQLSGASNVVSLLDSGTEDLPIAGLALSLPLRFHVFELADDSLNVITLDPEAIPWAERLELFRGVVRGVHQMHTRGVVHRDLKSSNCLLFVRSGGVVTKVADLGRSRQLRAPATRDVITYRFTRGDPDFAPPEFLWGLGRDDADTFKRADLYGLGSLFFELAVGQGMTSLVGPALQPRHPPWMLDPNSCAAIYTGELARLRAAYEQSFTVFAEAVPAAIRPQAVALVRQLCDPDPTRRMPANLRGRLVSPDPGMNWLLRRTDILRRTLKNAADQESQQLQRKGARA